MFSLVVVKPHCKFLVCWDLFDGLVVIGSYAFWSSGLSKATASVDQGFEGFLSCSLLGLVC